jgi:hypothetical protein
VCIVCIYLYHAGTLTLIHYHTLHKYIHTQLFAGRVLKLIELFTTLDQFLALSHNKLEGMEVIIAQFHAIVKARS